MALVSIFLDFMIESLEYYELFIYDKIRTNPNLNSAEQYLLAFIAWLLLPLLSIYAAIILCQKLAPLAAGSGIPHIKTVLRGFESPEYFSTRTLGVKIFGLIFAIGSRLPLGKEGPFVHIACCLACLMSKFIFKRNDYFSEEILSAACAVGIACNFAAPIGGVLFAIEVTTTYFAVRNYWRSFFAAICGTFLYQIITFKNDVHKESLTALFRTNFPLDFPFHPNEMVLFIFMGIVAGLASAIFIKSVKTVMKSRERGQFKILPKLEFLFKIGPNSYAILITLLYCFFTFPLGFGNFVAGKLSIHEAIDMLFDNETWARKGYIDEGEEIQEIDTAYQHPLLNVYFCLVLVIGLNFLFTIFSITIKVPCGVFMPVFFIGAAFGRLIGEAMAAWFPLGLGASSDLQKIIPGGYAVVGAAALSGGVTRTISSAIIVFELTGQISHIVPVMVSVLISNAIASCFEPSIYDAIINVKKLPYLGDMDSRKNNELIKVEHFMVKVKTEEILTIGSSVGKVISDLFRNQSLSKFSVVNENGVFLGVVGRAHLEQELMVVQNSMGKETTEFGGEVGENSVNQVVFKFQNVVIDAGVPMISGKNTLHDAHRMFSVLKYNKCYGIDFEIFKSKAVEANF